MGRERGPAVALVTGAAGRTGSAVVARLRSDGFVVAGVDVAPCEADLVIQADVADRDAVSAAVATVADRLGPVTVLVTAAGLREAAPFGSLPPERWSRLLATHLGGTANACAAVLPGMVAAGRGTVVTRASAEAVEGAGDAYLAAASGTLLAFTRSLAVEVAPAGIRFNCVAGGSPAAVADLVSFLARDGDFYVGQVFAPAGGEGG